jgi:Asp-tRNA(Asn)/Glu-tRNA(Gln) amidotransferase A subunit family amidase
VSDSVLLGGAGAAELRERLLAGVLCAGEVAEAFLASVGDDPLRAWVSVDRDGLLRQAAALQAVDPGRRERMPLYGIPVGIKDNFDTVDLPTRYGSPIYAGHRPAADAAAVASLRAAGALIAGKLACAEFAWMTPPETVNPLDPERTPGGSSNGSAAAVAAGTVPLATGSQTAGSVNRPASYCGVFGYKPTFGRYDRAGIKLMSPTLDTVGVFTRTVEDLRLLDVVLGAAAPGDPSAACTPPRLAFARTPRWDAVEPAAAAAIEAWLALARGDGIVIDELELPAYTELAEAQESIQRHESARSLAGELREHASQLSEPLRAALALGAAIPEAVNQEDRALAARLRPSLVEVLRGYDGVLTPSATGVPPLGLSFTGDPLFCRVWTLIGAPSLSVPLVWAGRLPVALQLVGAPGRDRALLDAAEWLLRA